MANVATKTEIFNRLAITENFKLPYTVDGNATHSTLNEKFAMGLKNSQANKYPDIQYFAIGRGGHASSIGASNSVLIDQLQHRPTDACLFEHIPFVLTETTQDLSPAERANYRLRVKETYDGTDYWAYYLKTFVNNAQAAISRIITIQNGIITNDVLYNGVADQTPIPISISNTVPNLANGRHLLTQVEIPIILNQTDIDNIIGACTIKYGDSRYATISEVAIVGGYDKPNSSGSDNNGGTILYTEVQCAQVMAFINVLESLQQHPQQITFNFAASESAPYPPAP